jgi:hypothetical protein
MVKCACITAKGTRCTFNTKPGSQYCGNHLAKGCKRDFEKSSPEGFSTPVGSPVKGVSPKYSPKKSPGKTKYNPETLAGQPLLVLKNIFNNLEPHELRDICKTSKEVLEKCKLLDNSFWKTYFDKFTIMKPDNKSYLNVILNWDFDFTNLIKRFIDDDKYLFDDKVIMHINSELVNAARTVNNNDNYKTIAEKLEIGMSQTKYYGFNIEDTENYMNDFNQEDKSKATFPINFKHADFVFSFIFFYLESFIPEMTVDFKDAIKNGFIWKLTLNENKRSESDSDS